MIPKTKKLSLLDGSSDWRCYPTKQKQKYTVLQETFESVMLTFIHSFIYLWQNVRAVSSQNAFGSFLFMHNIFTPWSNRITRCVLVFDGALHPRLIPHAQRARGKSSSPCGSHTLLKAKRSCLTFSLWGSLPCRLNRNFIILYPAQCLQTAAGKSRSSLK